MLRKEAGDEALQAVRAAVAAAFPGGLPEGMESLAADLEDGSGAFDARVWYWNSASQPIDRTGAQHNVLYCKGDREPWTQRQMSIISPSICTQIPRRDAADGPVVAASTQTSRCTSEDLHYNNGLLGMDGNTWEMKC